MSEKEYNVQQEPHFLKVRFRHVRTCNRHDILSISKDSCGENPYQVIGARFSPHRKSFENNNSASDLNELAHRSRMILNQVERITFMQQFPYHFY